MRVRLLDAFRLFLRRLLYVQQVLQVPQVSNFCERGFREDLRLGHGFVDALVGIPLGRRSSRRRLPRAASDLLRMSLTMARDDFRTPSSHVTASLSSIGIPKSAGSGLTLGALGFLGTAPAPPSGFAGLRSGALSTFFVRSLATWTSSSSDDDSSSSKSESKTSSFSGLGLVHPVALLLGEGVLIPKLLVRAVLVFQELVHAHPARGTLRERHGSHRDRSIAPNPAPRPSLWRAPGALQSRLKNHVSSQRG